MLFRNDKKDNRETGGASRLPLLPLRDIIVFPHMVVPLFVGRQKSIKALEEAVAGKKMVFLVTQRDAKVNDPVAEDLYQIGTIGNVVQLLRLPDGTVKVLVEGKKRGRVVRHLGQSDCFWAEIEEIEEHSERSTEIEPLIGTINSTFENYVRLNKKIPPEMIMSTASIDDPARLADTIIAQLGVKLEDKQALLETFNS